MKIPSIKSQIVFLLLSVISQNTYSQTFADQTGISLTGVVYSSAAWGDYDNDGDLDILLCGAVGYDSNFNPVSKVYKNNGGTGFVEQTTILLTGVFNSSNAWVDFDNDGDLDIFLSGSTDGTDFSSITKIYRNNGSNVFNEVIGLNLTGVSHCTSAWGDYDNDGDLDLLLSGSDKNSLRTTKLYRNNGNSGFLEITGTRLAGVTSGSVAWGDYDNDGLLDILIAGEFGYGFNIAKIYKNNGNGSFTEQTGIVLPGIYSCSLKWGDYDNDGDIDLVCTGYSSSGQIAKIYRNNGNNSFSAVSGISLTGVTNSSSDWGDYDNDGDIDLHITGNAGSNYLSKVYQNNGNNTFTELTTASLTGVSYGSSAWGDYDNDGDLDILLTGYTGSTIVSKIFKNSLNIANNAPSTSSISPATVSGTDVVLKWRKVTDDHTPAKTITYNVKVGTLTGGINIVSPGAAVNGYRRIPSMGNGQLDTTFILKNLKKGTYFWSVQAVDQAYKGSTFSPEGSFVITQSSQASELNVENIYGTKVRLQWTRGNGTNCIVFAREGNSGTAIPVDNTIYTAQSVFKLGTQIGLTGWYCVYKGVSDSVTIKGLTAGTNYICQVFEFDGAAGAEKFLTQTGNGNPLVFKTNLFIEIPAAFSNATSGTTLWGDYDNDGDLDILIACFGVTEVFSNQGNGVFAKTVNISSFSSNSAAWGDYDKDGYLDILICGNKTGPATAVFRNNGDKTFSEQTDIQIPGVTEGCVTWADYDNDGDLDIFVTGESSSVRITKLFQNFGKNKFIEVVGLPFASLGYSAISASDLDDDGYLDIILIGRTGSTVPETHIYHNNGNNSFSELENTSVGHVSYGSIDAGDYDNDGDLDILLTGQISKIYKNNGSNKFSELTNVSLPGVWGGNASWGDYDNDGRLDILLTGGTTGAWPDFKQVTRLYHNDGGDLFSEIPENALPQLHSSRCAWGDYDNDGDLDLFLIGEGYQGKFSKIYRNETKTPNIIPATPAGIQSQVIGVDLKLKWNKVATDNTPYKAMTYNLRMGTTPGGINIVSPHSASNGFRRIASIGNMQLDTSTIIKNLLPGTYYYSIQAVDNSFAGSAFTTEKSIIINEVQADSLQAKIISSNSINLKWLRGNGEKCVVFCKKGSTTVASPVDNTSYLADNEFGFGSQVGTSGWYCVYNGKNDSVVVSGMSDLFSYTFHVIEYTGGIGTEHYFTPPANANPGVFGSALFTEQTTIDLASVIDASALWADFNNDKYLDILLVSNYGSELYINNGNNSFTAKPALLLPDADKSFVSLGDYDNDGDIDVLINGYFEGAYKTKLYNNNGSAVFTERTDVTLTGTSEGCVRWGDYDNDGDLDILLTGYTGTTYITTIYKNTNGNFSNSGISLPGCGNSIASWADYDNDGDLDIQLTGNNPSKGYYSEIYINKGEGVFVTHTNISLLEVARGSVDWGDYNNDGKLDLLMSGGDWSVQNAKIYKNVNDTNLVEQTVTGIEGVGVERTSCNWVDFDNDGDLDILVSGYNLLNGRMAKLYKNNSNNQFSEVLTPFIGVDGSSTSWGDYDNDGDMDLLLTGYTASIHASRIYRNNTIMTAGNFIANKIPEAPAGTSTQNTSAGVLLKWNPVKTDETKYKTITYNLRVGISKNGFETLSPNSGISGYRRIVSPGNAQLDTTFLMRKLQSGKYYWNVQAVDQGYLGGVWSVVDSFTVKNTQAFFKTDTVCLGLDTHFTDQSVASEGIASWKWDFKDGTISSLQNPVHTFGSGGAHYVKLVVTSTSGIKDSLEKTILVKPRPITDFSATTACQGSETGLVNLTNNSGLNITSWSWDYGDGKGSILQNPGSHGYLNAGDYQLTLTVTADNGCSGTVTKSVTVGAYPIAAITANTPLSFCSGGSVILSVTNNPDYSYRWMLNKTGITGAVSNNFTANLSGIYSVEVTNTRGSCIDTSAIVSVVKLDMPAIPLIVTENYQEGKCPGEVPVVLKVDQPVNEYNYQWKRNGTPINNALTSSHQGFLPAGDYSVVVNQQGCKAESEVKTIIYDEAPAKPFIYVQGPSVWYLTCSNDSASKYRWYCNDNLIEGADKYYYVANRKMGKYKVSIANTKGCFTMSDVISIPTGTTGIEDTDPFSGLKIYPNPTPGLFIIEMENQVFGELVIDIVTQDGKKTLNIKFEKTTEHFASQIDLSGQSKGMYIINLALEEFSAIRKVIVE